MKNGQINKNVVIAVISGLLATIIVYSIVGTLNLKIKRQQALIKKLKTNSLSQELRTSQNKFSKNSILISKDSRAMTIPINYIIGMSSYIKPNCFVDMILSSNNSKTTSPVVLKSIRVISLEKSEKSSRTQSLPSKSISAITFEVPSKYIPALAEIMQRGKIQLALRNNEEEIPDVSSSSISFQPLPPPPDKINFKEDINDIPMDLSLPADFGTENIKIPTAEIEFIKGDEKTTVSVD